MKSRRLVTSFLAVLITLCATPLQALLAPQDNWHTWVGSGWTLPGAPVAIGIGPDESVYVAVRSAETTTIRAYTSTGVFIREFGAFPAYANLGGIAVNSVGEIAIFHNEAGLVSVFDQDGTLLRQFGGLGTGNGLFGEVFGSTALAKSLLAIDSQDNFYVSDIGNRLIQKFDLTGAFVSQWGGPGTLAGQLGGSGPLAIGITQQGKLAVLSRSSLSTTNLQYFTTEGVWESMHPLSGLLLSSDMGITIMVDGLIHLNRSSLRYVLDETLTLHSVLGGAPSGHIAAAPSGRLYLATTNGTNAVRIYERSYLVENPPVFNALPQPFLIGTEQRPSTPYVDIDYKVVDTDDATVRVALLGFLEGGNDLSKVLKLATFVEDTAANIGPDQPSNQVRRVTWNAAADWAVEFGDVQFEVLAKDARGLMPFHWITLPAQGEQPAIEISQRPVTETEWLHLWYWLIATNDPGFTLTDGQITGASGAFVDQILATTADGVSATTAEGRAYLCEKLGIRAITEAEVTRATAGQFGFSAVTLLSVVKVTPAP